MVDLAASRNYCCQRQFHSVQPLGCIDCLLRTTILIAKINLVYFYVFAPLAHQKYYGFSQCCFRPCKFKMGFIFSAANFRFCFPLALRWSPVYTLCPLWQFVWRFEPQVSVPGHLCSPKYSLETSMTVALSLCSRLVIWSNFNSLRSDDFSFCSSCSAFIVYPILQRHLATCLQLWPNDWYVRQLLGDVLAVSLYYAVFLSS